MSKVKTLMVSFLGVSLVFALMVTTIPTLANAETLAPSEPGVSLGKPLSDATLKETTAMGTYTITTFMFVKTGTGTATSTVSVNLGTISYQKSISPPPGHTRIYYRTQSGTF
jgi:hypothetical protein